MSEVKVYYAIYDGMSKGTPSDSLITFVEKKRTKQPLISGGGNLGFVKLVKKSDYDSAQKKIEAQGVEIAQVREQAAALFRALNTAHCYVDKRENPRAEKICVDALKSYEVFRDEAILNTQEG